MGGLRIRLGAAPPPSPVSLAVARAAMLIAGRDVVPTLGGNATFTFGSDQNPLASPFVAPNASGFFNVQALGGIACATTASDSGYPDCYAIYSGITGGDYEVEGLIFKSGSLNTSINHEIELHVAMSQDGVGCTSYEWLVNQVGGGQLMRWNGNANDGSGSFFNEVTVDSGNVSPLLLYGGVANGDSMMMRKVGSTLTLHYKQSGGSMTQVAQLNTMAHTAGSPGIAFFARNGATVTNFGFDTVAFRQL